jgi:uncharacterized protein (DUF952 family)
MAERIFHSVLAREWRATPAGAPWRPASLDSEGFVHLSFESQLARTLELHFPPEEELYLLELDPAQLEPDLRLEASRGGALFPHLYRALELTDTLRWWQLAPGEGQRLPAELDAQARIGAPPRDGV